MSDSRMQAKVDQAIPYDCRCPPGFANVNLTGLIVMLGCADCGGFAVSLTGDLDSLIGMLQEMKANRDKGLPVAHPAGRVATVTLK